MLSFRRRARRKRDAAAEASEEMPLDPGFTQEVEAIVLDSLNAGEEITLDSTSTEAKPADELVELEATDASMLEKCCRGATRTSRRTAPPLRAFNDGAPVSEEVTLDSSSTPEEITLNFDTPPKKSRSVRST